MARPVTKGLKYFNLDVNFFQDRKVRRLQRRFGEKAPLVYIATLCSMYAEGYYIKWDDDFVLDIADLLRIEEKEVKTIIDGCLSVGLFSQEMFDKERILTSHGIQLQYQTVSEQSRRKSSVDEFSLLVPSEETEGEDRSPVVPSEETPDLPQEPRDNSEKMQEIKIKESKLKERKVNISSPLSSSPEGEEETKEKIVSYFTFEKNWLSPNKEYENLVAYYSGPEAKVKWRDMSEEDKVSLRTRWRQLPEQPPRFSKASLSAWKSVYETLCSLGAPLDVRMDALSDDVNWYGINGTLMLVVSERLYRYIEVPPDPDTPPRLGRFKPYLRQLMKACGCKELSYDYGERN